MCRQLSVQSDGSKESHLVKVLQDAIAEIESHPNKTVLLPSELETLARAKRLLKIKADIPDDLLNRIKFMKKIICW